MGSVKESGATLRDPPSLKARKEEAPYIIDALRQPNKYKAREAIDGARSFSDNSRRAIIESIRGKRG